MMRHELERIVVILVATLHRRLGEPDIKSGSQLTRGYLEVYIMAVTWLLIFDKVSVTKKRLSVLINRRANRRKFNPGVLHSI